MRMMIRDVTLAALALALSSGLCACGGRQNSGGEAGGEGGAGGAAGGENQLIPEEKYDEIDAIFDGKIATVSRCYAEEEESGDQDRSEKGHVTVGLTINPDGSASHVRVMESSFNKKIGDCVVRLVSGWTFTTLPRPLEISHTYVLDRL